MARHSLQSQIAEVEQEIAMRHRVYRGQVASRAMREGEAELKIALMESVLATLRFCREHEQDIRAYIAARRSSGGAEG